MKVKCKEKGEDHLTPGREYEVLQIEPGVPEDHTEPGKLDYILTGDDGEVGRFITELFEEPNPVDFICVLRQSTHITLARAKEIWLKWHGTSPEVQEKLAHVLEAALNDVPKDLQCVIYDGMATVDDEGNQHGSVRP